MFTVKTGYIRHNTITEGKSVHPLKILLDCSTVRSRNQLGSTVRCSFLIVSCRPIILTIIKKSVTIKRNYIFFLSKKIIKLLNLIKLIQNNRVSYMSDRILRVDVNGTRSNSVLVYSQYLFLLSISYQAPMSIVTRYY